MAKLTHNIIWEGVYYTKGSEAPDGVPGNFTDAPKKKKRKKKTETKNGAPKTEDK